MTDEKIDFASESCVPSNADDLPIAVSEGVKWLPHLNEGWSINQAGRLERIFLLKDFEEGMLLATKLAKVAKAAEHFPDLHLSFGKVRVEIWTNKIGGLSRADFVLAAKFDQALSKT